MAESLSAAAAAQPPPAFQTRFACVPLNKQDCIRFISFGADDVASMRNTVQAAWLKGINSVRPYGGADEFKLHGNPWETDGWGNDDARRLVRRMLEGLFDRGWVLQAGVDTSKKVMDKASRVFRYQSPPPPACEWLNIAFYRSDRLWLLDRPLPDLAAA